MIDSKSNKIDDFSFKHSGFSSAYILRGQLHHDRWISPSILLCLIPDQDFSEILVKIWNPDLSDLDKNSFCVSFDKASEQSGTVSRNADVEISVKSSGHRNEPVLLSIECKNSYTSGGEDNRLLGVILQEVKLV